MANGKSADLFIAGLQPVAGCYASVETRVHGTVKDQA
jgi:hypothetical protein